MGEAGIYDSKTILAAHAVAGGSPPQFRPDAAVFVGEEGLGALARFPLITPALNPNAIFVAAGEGANVELIRRCEEEAIRRAFVFLDPYGYDLPSGLYAAGSYLGGGLIAAVGGGPATAFTEALLYEIGKEGAEQLLKDGVFGMDTPAGVHRILARGELSPSVCALDVGLYIAQSFGPGGLGGAVLELAGPLPESWERQEREDAAGAAMLAGAAAAITASRTGASTDAIYEYDFAPLRPAAALIRDGRLNVADVEDIGNDYDLGSIILGPGAGPTGLRAAAAILQGREIYSGCQLWVVPSSRQVLAAAAREGTLETILAAGGLILPPGAELRTQTSSGWALTTSPRLFARAPERFILTNPCVAAASALSGYMVDPRPLCGD